MPWDINRNISHWGLIESISVSSVKQTISVCLQTLLDTVLPLAAIRALHVRLAAAGACAVVHVTQATLDVVVLAVGVCIHATHVSAFPITHI